MTLTVSGLWTAIGNQSFKSFARVSDAMKLSLVNRAIENRHTPELVNICPEIYEGEAEITGDGTNEISLPSDIQQGIPNITLYYDTKKTLIVPRIYYDIVGGVLRFPMTFNSTWYLTYTKRPNVYTALTDNVDESDNSRALQILLSEIEALYEMARQHGRASARYQSLLQEANRLK